LVEQPGLGAEMSGPKLLSEIAEQTWRPRAGRTNLRELPGIAERIGIELRNQYVLAYSPTNNPTATASIERSK
jgi:Ca-activated chloride channel family protein